MSDHALSWSLAAVILALLRYIPPQTQDHVEAIVIQKPAETLPYPA